MPLHATDALEFEREDGTVHAHALIFTRGPATRPARKRTLPVTELANSIRNALDEQESPDAQGH